MSYKEKRELELKKEAEEKAAKAAAEVSDSEYFPSWGNEKEEMVKGQCPNIGLKHLAWSKAFPFLKLLVISIWLGLFRTTPPWIVRLVLKGHSSLMRSCKFNRSL